MAEMHIRLVGAHPHGGHPGLILQIDNERDRLARIPEGGGGLDRLIPHVVRRGDDDAVGQLAAVAVGIAGR